MLVRMKTKFRRLGAMILIVLISISIGGISSTNVQGFTTSEIVLFEGWNLIGLPCTPVDSSIDVVLADILDNVESVWTFDGEAKTWLVYSPGFPSDLTEMVEGRGYWIKMNTDAILTIYCESACSPYIDFQGTIWAGDGYGPAFTSPYDAWHRFLYLYDGQATPTGSNIIIPLGLNAVIEGFELNCTESAYDDFYVDGHPFGTSEYNGGSCTIYLDDSAIITLEDITIVTTYYLDSQDIHGYGWATLTGVPESEGGIGLYEDFIQFSDTVLITEFYSRYPLAWDDPFLYDITFRLKAAREISLFEGWNLISLPCIPEDPSIEVVLSEIIDYVDCVWGFDEDMETFSVYSPGAPSDLTEMVEGRGYWIKMNTDAILTICVDSVCAP